MRLLKSKTLPLTVIMDSESVEIRTVRASTFLTRIGQVPAVDANSRNTAGAPCKPNG
jgi:hypothetical protein